MQHVSILIQEQVAKLLFSRCELKITTYRNLSVKQQAAMTLNSTASIQCHAGTLLKQFHKLVTKTPQNTAAHSNRKLGRNELRVFPAKVCTGFNDKSFHWKSLKIEMFSWRLVECYKHMSHSLCATATRFGGRGGWGHALALQVLDVRQQDLLSHFCHTVQHQVALVILSADKFNISKPRVEMRPGIE